MNDHPQSFFVLQCMRRMRDESEVREGGLAESHLASYTGRIPQAANISSSE